VGDAVNCAIVGTVRGPDGGALPDCDVYLDHRAAHTNADGVFVLETTPGTHALMVKADGYRPYEQRYLIGEGIEEIRLAIQLERIEVQGYSDPELGERLTALERRVAALEGNP
jgi:hypothetical protein